MDSVDHSILFHLQREGRLSNVELAERVGLSPSPCLRRVRQLEADGVITGYHARIDPAAVGRAFQVVVHAEMAMANRQTIEMFDREVAKLDEVTECLRMFGDPGYLIRVAVADLPGYERFYMSKLADLPGVAKLTTQMTMKTIKAADPNPSSGRL
jgi:Lrp/AsnC family transcriptional regulator, leucine-responsive regulatory protein